MKNTTAYHLRHAIAEAHGHPVFTLPCGSVGTLGTLYRGAVALGFNGSRKGFSDRFHKAGGTKTLAELAEPSQAVARKPKRDDGELQAAIRGMSEEAIAELVDMEMGKNG